MLSRLKIGPKLLLAPGAVLLLLVLLSSGAWYAMVRQNQSLEDIVGQRAAHMRAVSELVITAQRGHAEVYRLQPRIGGSFPGDQSISASATGGADTAFAAVAERLNDLAQLERRLSQRAAQRAAADFRTMTWLMPAVIALAIAISLRITVAVRRALLTEIRGIEAAAIGLASGDLSVREGVYGSDEIAETSRALHASIRNLNGKLRTILESARSIGAASRDLALGNLNLSTRASFRASSLEHTTSSMQGLAATVHLAADSAQAANRLAASAANVAQQGESGELAKSVAEIEGGTAWAAQADSGMATIAVSVQQVGDIIGQTGSASREQASGLLDVNQAVVQMDQVTQRNSTLVEEAAESARTLQMQALTLSRAVAAFRLDEAAGKADAPLRPSSRAEVDLRDILKDGRRDASQPGPNDRRKSARGHLRLASSRD